MDGRARVLLFATAREEVGRREIDLELPTGGMAVGAALEELVARYPGLKAVLATARLARNGRYLPRGRLGRLDEGDELAIHPPYSGG